MSKGSELRKRLKEKHPDFFGESPAMRKAKKSEAAGAVAKKKSKLLGANKNASESQAHEQRKDLQEKDGSGQKGKKLLKKEDS